MSRRQSVQVRVNGVHYDREVESRLLLSDFLRHQLGLTGTHVGCEHGVCGACTVLLNGEPVRSCLMLAVQADNAEITTIEGVSQPDGALSAVQQALHRHHGLQCGFCTPGFVLTIEALLREAGPLTEEEIRAALSGNICRCTGYYGIINAVQELVEGKEVARQDAQSPLCARESARPL